MAMFNDPRFMIYSKGYHPEQLRLGHLVLGPYYHDPVDQTSRICLGPFLSEAELGDWTHSVSWRGRCVAKKGPNFGFELEGFDLAHVSPNIDWTGSIILDAEEGRRIELKDPAKFLAEKVLSEARVQDVLKLWLSIARANYLVHRMSFRPPKIWMLTALYELKDVKRSKILKKNISVSTGVSSLLVGLSGIPIGASISAGHSSETSSDSFVKEPMVYAARYQLLEARYLRKGDNGWTNIKLHPDNLYSRGFTMGGEEDNWRSDSQAATLEFGGSQGEQYAVPTEEEIRYWKLFDQTEGLLLEDIEETSGVEDE